MQVIQIPKVCIASDADAGADADADANAVGRVFKSNCIIYGVVG